MVELKPCPFCGHAGKLDSDIRWPDGVNHGVDSYFVICPNYYCPIYRADNTWFKTPEEAIEAWNRRIENEKTVR